MSMLSFLKPTLVGDVPENHYLVVHPLDDAREEKVETSDLGPMPLTRTVKISLLVLRGYLVLMVLLVLYHVLQLAGVVGNAH